MMSASEYAVLIVLLLLGSAFDQEDFESFYIWTCVASFIAGLPFMTTF